MGLLQKSRVGQIGHDIANRGRAEALTIAAGQRARAYGLAGGDVGLHDGGENFALSPSNAFGCRHISRIRRNLLFCNMLANNPGGIRQIYSKSSGASMSRLALA